MKTLSQLMLGVVVLVGLPAQAATTDTVIQGVATANKLVQNGVVSGPQVFSAIPEPSQYGLFLALAVAGVVVWRRFVRSARKA